MRISNLEVFVLGTNWRNLVFVKLTTDECLTGVGEASLTNLEDAVVADLGGARNNVLGSVPFDIEDLWQRMFRNDFWRDGVVADTSMPFFAEGAGAVGLSAAIVGTRKTPFASLDPRVKSLNYLNVIKSRIEARNLGANESILLDDRGRVVEASIYNIIAVSGNQLMTPREGCLEGITLETTLEVAARLGFTVERGPVYPYDLESADEIIFTSTAVGLLPLLKLNGCPVGSGQPGSVYARLNDAYQQALSDPAQGVSTALAAISTGA